MGPRLDPGLGMGSGWSRDGDEMGPVLELEAPEMGLGEQGWGQEGPRMGMGWPGMGMGESREGMTWRGRAGDKDKGHL